MIVESGKFDWEASGKFASLTEPNPSYHGVSFTKACGPAAFVTKIRAILLRDTGATISPVSSFIFLQGLETLSLRVERHVENALKVVQYLNNHPQVEKVHHPSVTDDESQKALYAKYFPNGGGSIFTFEILLSIRLQQHTASAQKKNFSIRVSNQIQFVFPLVQRILTISFRILMKHLRQLLNNTAITSLYIV